MGYEATTWNGIIAPAGVPKAIIAKLNAKLNAEINRALAMPSLREKFAAIGAEPVGGSSAQFAALIKTEHAKWADVIKRTGAKVD